MSTSAPSGGPGRQPKHLENISAAIHAAMVKVDRLRCHPTPQASMRGTLGGGCGSANPSGTLHPKSASNPSAARAALQVSGRCGASAGSRGTIGAPPCRMHSSPGTVASSAMSGSDPVPSGSGREAATSSTTASQAAAQHAPTQADMNLCMLEDVSPRRELTPRKQVDAALGSLASVGGIAGEAEMEDERPGGERPPCGDKREQPPPTRRMQSPFRRTRPVPDGGVRSILERLQLEDSSSRYLPGYEEMGQPQALPAPPPNLTPGLPQKTAAPTTCKKQSWRSGAPPATLGHDAEAHAVAKKQSWKNGSPSLTTDRDLEKCAGLPCTVMQNWKTNAPPSPAWGLKHPEISAGPVAHAVVPQQVVEATAEPEEEESEPEYTL